MAEVSNVTNEIQKPASESEGWTDLNRAFDALRQRVYDAWGVAPFGAVYVTEDGGSSPAYRAARTDVRDLGASFQIVAEVPGIPKDKIDVRVRGASVEIVGATSSESSQTSDGYVHRERTTAGFRRSVELPEAVVASEAKATVHDGLLELELPKQHPTPSPAEVRVAVQ